MAQTFQPSGIVAPDSDGEEGISSVGVTELVTVAATANTGIAASRFAKPKPAPFDFDTFKEPGSYAIGAPFPDGWANVPSQITTASVVNIYGSPDGTWCAQEIIQYGSNPVRVWRVSATTSLWNPWVVVGALQGSAMASNAVLQTDFISKTGGIVNTGGKAGFALRLDHGWANIKSKLRTELIARGIVPGVATNSRNWGLAENAGVTLSEVNTWVAAGEMEIINHSATHHGGLNESQLVDEIVTGKLELESQIPAAAPIFGFAPPGVNAGWDGFNGGRIDGWTSPAARIILESHAYCLGYVGGARRVMDGTIRQGLSHTTLDSYDLQTARNQIDSAILERRGIQFMIHPSQLDQPGRITTAEFLDFLDYAVAKRDAGELVFMSPGEMVRGDSSRRTPAAHTHPWGEVTGKPATFAPSAHTHTQAQVSGLADALAGKRTIAPMVIGEGVNLNNVTTPGEHSQQFTAWATTALNYPAEEGQSPVAGRLLVAANTARTQVTQFYIPFTSSVLEIWMRNFYNTWGAWERLPMARDLALKANADHPLLYDSGWRDVTSSLGGAVAADSIGKYYLRRRAGMVLVRFENVKLAGGGSTNLAWSSLPVGFQPVGAGGGGEMFQVGTATRTGGTAYIMPDGAHLRLHGVRPTAWEAPVTQVPAGHIVNGAFSFATVDAVPTSLPGTPA